MFIESIDRRQGRTRPQVHIASIARDRQVSDDCLAGFAMAKAGEDPSTLFGWHVCRFTREDGTTESATVALHTD